MATKLTGRAAPCVRYGGRGEGGRDILTPLGSEYGSGCGSKVTLVGSAQTSGITVHTRTQWSLYEVYTSYIGIPRFYGFAFTAFIFL